MQKLTTKERAYLKALAHKLKVCVLIGAKGITNSVIKEIMLNLAAHELIKIRIFGAARAERAVLADKICTQVDARLVELIGSLVVIYKPSLKSKISLNNVYNG